MAGWLSRWCGMARKPKRNPCIICGRHVPDLKAAFCRACWEHIRAGANAMLGPGMKPMPDYDHADEEE